MLNMYMGSISILIGITFLVASIILFIYYIIKSRRKEEKEEIEQCFTHKYKDLKPGDVFCFRKNEGSPSFFEIVYEIGIDKTSQFWNVFENKPYILVFTPICAEDGPGGNNMDLERGCDIICDPDLIEEAYDRAIKEVEKKKERILDYERFLTVYKHKSR